MRLPSRSNLSLSLSKGWQVLIVFSEDNLVYEHTTAMSADELKGPKSMLHVQDFERASRFFFMFFLNVKKKI